MKEKMNGVMNYLENHSKAIGLIISIVYTAGISIWYFRFMKKMLIGCQEEEDNIDRIISDMETSSESWDELLK